MGKCDAHANKCDAHANMCDAHASGEVGKWGSATSENNLTYWTTMQMIAPDDLPERFRNMYDESAALEIEDDEEAVSGTPPGAQP